MNVSHTRQQVISGQVITRIQSWHITSVRHAMLPRHQTRNMDKGAEKRKTAAAFSHTGDARLDCGGVSAAIFRQSDCLLRNPLCPLCASQLEVKKTKKQQD